MHKPFHHALRVDEETCFGCTRCMTICPTGAIRVSRGKAHVDPARCVDCGNCMEVCPVDAIVVEQDDFQKIYRYRHRIAVVPSVMIGQFDEEISEEQIYSTLLELGFTAVYEAEFGSDILRLLSGRYITYASKHPIISSFCPAIVRLIQVRFPGLVGHLNLIKPPLDLTAHYAKTVLMEEEGAEPEQIGIFYVTPCAAKIAAIKSPIGEEESIFDGVINMNYLFNLVHKTIVRQKKEESCTVPPPRSLSGNAVIWSLTGGEAPRIRGRSLAVDGIHNVIEFLEKLENGEIEGVDFLELRSCDEGCAGGILGSGNRFLTAERLHHRAKKMEGVLPEVHDRVLRHSEALKKEFKLEHIEPRSIVKLDDDMEQAVEKMEQIEETLKQLPKVDCGVCGSPSCEALAHDVVLRGAEINRCIFLQRRQEQLEPRNVKENLRRMRSIWGDDKLGE
jgi:iron only hydrogenase large subunit-like protein